MNDIDRYDYHLPPGLIRREGVEPRDSARLFVYDTAADRVTHAVFRDIAGFLPEGSLLVLNDTRVVPARLWLAKETGGKIEVFVLANEMDPGAEEIPIIVDRKCLPGWKLSFPDGSYFEVTRQEENRFFVRLRGKRTLEELLDTYGETPVPHYLESDTHDEARLRSRYQSVFAAQGASVAAPTASLHFTERVFDSLDARGIARARVTLDVGRGTFAPLTDTNWKDGRLHAERYAVPEGTAEAIITAQGAGHPVVAVGTTALRTLESAIDENGRVRPGTATTEIFIRPPYRFRAADALVTNFHLPKTSLMLLVDAFLGYKGVRRDIMSLYDEAIREGYAFYSFGDSMLIL